jgi:predicted nucleic acid-binding protein
MPRQKGQFSEVRLFSKVVSIDGTLRAVTADADDDKFVECALAGNAALIVSGDHHLLDLGSFQDIRIVSAAEFLELVEGTVTP